MSTTHDTWGEYWAAHGYVALLVDSFGPRARGHGYGRGSHDDADRDAVNERTVRPLDAEGALAFLAQRRDADASRIMLQGWSNGGSTALNAMYRQARDPHVTRFRAALPFYPGCGPKALQPGGLRRCAAKGGSAPRRRALTRARLAAPQNEVQSRFVKSTFTFVGGIPANSSRGYFHEHVEFRSRCRDHRRRHP
jgi:dienelactone hydrolase